MSVELRYKHQERTYELMKEELERTGKAAYVFPTGCGKTFPVLKYIEENTDQNVLIVAPSRAILNQYKKYIKQYIPEGEKLLKSKNIALITYRKLSLLMKKAKNINPKIMVFDEAHRTGAETYEPAVDEAIEAFPEAKAIAMTATPQRTDKRNMLYEKFEDSVVYEMSLTEALSGEKEGEVVLKSPRYIRVLSTLKEELAAYKHAINETKDDAKRQRLLERYQRFDEIVSNSPDIQDVVAAGMKKKNGKYIVFCDSIEDMEEKIKNAEDIFKKVNTKIDIEYVATKREKDDEFGKTQVENRKTLENFEEKEESDELKLLFCVDMLNEGVHLDGIDGSVMFRYTESNIIYKQQIGRVLSADEKAGQNVVIDAVNNWLRQTEAFNEIAGAIKEGDGISESHDYDLLKLTPEEVELLQILHEIQEETRYNYYNAYDEIIEWLEEHDGEMPRSAISEDEKYKVRKEMTEEENYEVNLYARWFRCNERKILVEYAGRPIEEVPEEYREKIAKLREYGLGKTVYEKIIEWLEEHNGEMPRSATTMKKKADEMTKEEKYEKNLYKQWINCKERQILVEYAGKPIEEVPEEYREKIAKLREYGLGLKEKTVYEEIIEWLEEHNGEMPRSHRILKKKVAEMTEEENYEVNLHGRWEHSEEKKILDEYAGRPIEKVPEEYREKIAKLREYGLGLKEKTVYEEIIEWLEERNGKMPRSHSILKKKVAEMTEEENYEVNLRKRWDLSKEKKILDEYAGRPIEEVPEEYREKIAKLREYGLGLKGKTTYEEIIEWLEEHDGKMPRGPSTLKKKVAEQTEEENYEVNLYARWFICNERKILVEYAGKPIEEVPEEYREKIAKLREYGLGLKEKTPYEKIIEWLEEHNGEMPRSATTMKKKADEMTKEEKYEKNLYQQWINCKERQILVEYAGKPIEEVPEEYREKIAKLREYGLGKTVYEEIIEWLEEHNGEMPRSATTMKKKADEMTKEEKYEKNLYEQWRNCKERQILDEYAGQPIEEVPEEHREKIARLRGFGLGVTVYEEIIEWLEGHNGEMPRGAIKVDGKTKKVAEQTEEENYEVNLRQRWNTCKERQILDEYAGRSIEEVPEEYREKIAKLRSLGQMGKRKDEKIKTRMKKSVAKEVESNEETREELEQLEMELQTTADFKGE